MGYGSVVGPGASFAGIDQGIDFVPMGSGGFDLLAAGSGTITLADASGHQFNRTSGQALIILQLDTDPNIPNGSRWIYYAEIITPAPGITVGAHVNAGTVLGHCNQSPGVEIGWGSGPTQGFKCPIGGETPCGSSFNNWVQGLPAGVGGDPTGGSSGPKCDGCGYGGIGFDWQPRGPGIPDFGNTKICILTGCQEKALKAGVITAAGGIVLGLGIILLVHWGMKDTEVGRSASRGLRSAIGLAGFLGGPEAGAATELLTHLGGRSSQPATQQAQPRTRPQARQTTAPLLPGEQPGAYEQFEATGAQPNGSGPQDEEPPERYMARMGA